MRTLLLFLCAASAYGAACSGTVTSPIVQCGFQEAGSAAGGNNALAFGSANTAGNAIVVGVTAHTGDTITCSDTANGTYTKAIDRDDGSFAHSYIYYFLNIASGSNTVTCHSSLTDAMLMAILEVSGIATSTAIDGTPGSAPYSFQTPTTGSTTTTNASDTLFAVLGYAPTGENPTTDAAWTEIDNEAGATLSARNRVWYRKVVATGTYSGTTASDTNTAGVGVIAAFKQTGGAAVHTMPPVIF